MTQPQMLAEIHQTPEVLQNQLEQNTETVNALVARLEASPPPFALTVARGSSDHAATFWKYLLETQLGLVTASATPSAVTMYGARLKCENALVVALSQSGQSPDVVRTLEHARAGGAVTVACVNVEDSPLAHAAEYVLPLRAGPEKAVAATKSYLATLGAGLHLAARWSRDAALEQALAGLPARLKFALEQERKLAALAESWKEVERCVVLARGFHFAVALELALKLKETCAIQAEAFSSAEFLHGPAVLVEEGFPLLVLEARDETQASTEHVLGRLEGMLASMTLLYPFGDPGGLHRLTDPLVTAVQGYLFALHLSLERGLNPDAPRTLSKVTKTL